ncbi:twin-arginine translocation signal domain-containing protein [Pseudomonas putida]|uniref:Twin-arginine translocation signal domain-containing protein n=1 Tax=Pseudomonas putida TaxID=303 RepID=A0A7W2QJG5_PSEPU|nr:MULTISPECIES: twin-arginine translocation signal domain-containing protein [Pseudomonas]MBA6116878.1 twin-arginine translocation signal domain-containing protein [Pseudomonas putida]MBI6941341.1 twin-arginine translocation signal domain-containing protein [Pseudomonas putida]MBI6959579.1 twin-arginine translocation signal domain-containing protein [Pseudomonas putida]MCZ9637599.1 twin-arginine translocation signal domain-containing protein [Pseudomonas putida]MEC4876618.1 twin-arginine tran
MGKLKFCTPLLGRRGFLRNCALLGVGGAVFGALPEVARKPAEPVGHVLINGWVLPSQYFRNEQA